MASSSIKPNLFLVGAPKCGTTALYTYLSEHPDIFAGPKELHYFGSDLSWRRQQQITWQEYLQCFRHARGERYRLDASVHYLLSRRAASEIASVDPAARIIMILRNPLDLVRSLYEQALYSQIEDLLDLQEALDIEEDRAHGIQVPQTCPNVEGILYQANARFGHQVERYLSAFPRQNVLILIYEEFAGDPGGAYREVLRFLDLPDDGRSSFPIVNPSNKVLRYPRLQQLVRAEHPLVRWLAGRVPLHMRLALGDRIDGANVRPSDAERISIPYTLRVSLGEEFAVEQLMLEEMLGRALPWDLDSGNDQRGSEGTQADAE